MCTHAQPSVISAATISFSSSPLQHKWEHRGPSALAGSFFLTGFNSLRGSLENKNEFIQTFHPRALWKILRPVEL